MGVDMIEIYLINNIFYESSLTLDEFYSFMVDDFIKPETFIQIPLSDGDSAYIRKSTVVSFNNVIEPVN